MNFHFKTALRHITGKPVYSLITFFGFTFGIAAALIVYLWIYNELSFDKFHLGYPQIYRVLTLTKQGDKIVKSAGNYRPLAKTLTQDFPQIAYATYLSFSSEDSPLQYGEHGEKIEARPMWTNADFFKIFDGFKFVEGTPEEAAKNPQGIILNKKVADKLFGNEPALGKEIIIDKYFKNTYTVTGVVRVPKQTHIDFGYIITEANPEVASYAQMWGDRGHVRVYMQLAKNAHIDDGFLSAVANQITRYTNKSDKILFQPLADIHLRTDYEPAQYDHNISDIKYVWIFSGLALIIILMAVLNFSVLSVARASERSTEIGIKKASGAGKRQILLQFMAESILQTVVAALLAVIIVWLILPWFNNFSGREITFDFSGKLLVNLLILTVLTGIFAGLYPALYLSSMNPVGIFRGGSATGSKNGFIRLLVTTQFAVAIFFMIATSVFVKQMNYVRTKDLGLQRDNIVVIPTGLWYGSKGFKDELMKNPNILGVSAGHAPVNFHWTIPFAVSHQGVMDSIHASMIWVDEDFAKTYRLEVVQGQFLQMNYDAYWEELSRANKNKDEKGENYSISMPVVINETAAKMLRFDDPVGQRLGGSNVIVGVVKDFHFRPLHHAIEPVVLVNDPQNIGTINVQISPENRAQTLQYIRETYRKYRDDREFSYSFFDDLIAEKYQDEMRLKNLTMAFALLAICISMLGILGMSVFSIERRIKEIGIRKVNGATVPEVMSMLNFDFVKWVLVAFVIAVPPAWFVMHRWLENFAYKTGLSWWIFALAGLLALLIAVITISFNSLKAATRNPVEALRYE